MLLPPLCAIRVRSFEPEYSREIIDRVLSTARSFMLGRFLGGGEVATSAAYALVVAVTDTALYAATELAFARWRGEGQASPAPVP
jgi:hypothetical protein